MPDVVAGIGLHAEGARITYQDAATDATWGEGTTAYGEARRGGVGWGVFQQELVVDDHVTAVAKPERARMPADERMLLLIGQAAAVGWDDGAVRAVWLHKLDHVCHLPRA